MKFFVYSCAGLCLLGIVNQALLAQTDQINGIEQWLSIRGRDNDNPVLLYLHGGPGAPFMPLSLLRRRGQRTSGSVV
jgi:hypothetical protein